MAFFGWVVVLYILTALICWSVFGHRFLCAKDIRRPRNSDLWDAFGPMIGMVLLAWTIILMNPGRAVRTAGKSLLWPVTLYRWFVRQGVAAPAESTSAPSGVTAPEWSAEPVGQAGAPPLVAPSDHSVTPPASTRAGSATPERFAGKSMVAPPSLPGAPMPRATSGPSSGRHMAGPVAGGVAPSWNSSAAGEPAWGRPPAPGGPAPRPAWGAAPPPRWAVPAATDQLGHPIARPATHLPPRHRPQGDR